MKLKAELQPLSGKYYGTKIIVSNDKNNKTEINIWENNDYTPSDRELEARGYTRHEWDTDAEIERIDSTHFENQSDYLFALEIMNKLNN